MPSLDGVPGLEFDPARILPDRDFSHHIGAQRCGMEDVFIRHRDHNDAIQERLSIVNEYRKRHVAMTEKGKSILRQAFEMAAQENVIPSEVMRGNETPETMLEHFLQNCEQDLVLMKVGTNGTLTMEGACVVYPSSWDPPSKVGQPLEQIHAIVPSLEKDIGRNIAAFMKNMPSKKPYKRSNWGMSASKGKNNHPALQIPRLTESTNLAEVSFRVEDQTLIRLPDAQNILFVIDLIRTDLLDVLQHPDAARGLKRALETMSPEMLRYKGLTTIRPAILRALETSS